MKRLIANRSINMNNEVQDFIINNDNRFDNEYISMAKKIIQKIRIMPTYERYYNLAQDIKNGKFDDLPDINNNLDLWVERAIELLKKDKILLSERFYSFNEIKNIETKDDHLFFDYDPNFDDSKFKLINISISDINNMDLNDNDIEEINLYLTEGIYEDMDIEQIGDLVKKIREGIKLSPIVLTKDNELIDGFHRCWAYMYLGIDNISAFKEV